MGQMLKQNLVPKNICPQLSLSLICAVQILQPQYIWWQLPGVQKASPVPDGRSPEGSFWWAALPTPASHVPHQTQQFPLPIQEVLRPIRLHKCLLSGEQGTDGTQGKGLGL